MRWRLVWLLARSYLAQKYHVFGLRVRWRVAFKHYDFCQAMDAMSLAAACGFAARGVPILLDVNEIPDPFERQGSHFVGADPAVKRHLATAFARDIAAATRIITTSDAMAGFVAERFGREAIPIRNARAPLTAPASFAIREDVGAQAGTRIMVYPCTAAPHLGVEASVEMLTRLPNEYRLVFVGRFVTPAYREEIERLIRRLGLTHRVVLKGELPDGSYLPYLAGADLGLVPLSFAYRNQRVVLPWRIVDLAAAGVPMVATRSEEIERLIRRCDLGEVAASAAPDDLAAAVRTLMASPPPRLAAIRGALRDLAESFSPAREQERYRTLLNELAPRRRGRVAFISNLALRQNRRLTEFVDQITALGWHVDLYCVRAPRAALFAQPDRVRAVEVSDRLMPRRLGNSWRTTRRAEFLRAHFPWLVGLAFGLTQLGRALRLVRAARRELARRGPWDIVIASDLFALPAGLALATTKTMLVYDANEIPDLRERTSPALRRIPAILRLPFRRWERRYVERAGLILTTGGALARYLRARYRRRSTAPVVAVRNAGTLDRHMLPPVPSVHPLRDLLGLPASDVVIVSPCGISAETGALVAVRMLRHLPADHVLVFIGRFSTRDAETAIRSAVRRERVAHRCFFVGETAYPTYLRYLADCDVGIVLFDPAIANMRLAAPNRVFDLIAIGVPIVSTGIEEVAGMIRRSKIGVVVRERRPVVVARAIRSLCREFGITRGGAINRGTRVRLDRVARFHRAEKETARLLDALAAQSGPLAGKRVALLTLRSAFSNRRFVRHAEALIAAGAIVTALDTDVGVERPAAPPADPLPWLTTIAVR